MALFGRKKKPEPQMQPQPQPIPEPAQFSPIMVGDILRDIARAVIGDYAAGHDGAPDTLTMTIEFDDQQRVSSISQPLANGAPFIPTFEVIERLNDVCRPWSAAPENGRPRSVSLTYDRGRFSSNIVYPD